TDEWQSNGYPSNPKHRKHGYEKADACGQCRSWNESDVNGRCDIIRLDMVVLNHQLTNPSRRSRVAGPIPETSSRLARFVKSPCCSRWAIICSAVAGPTPGNVSKAAVSAVLIFTMPVPTSAEPCVAAGELDPTFDPSASRFGTRI